MKIFFDSIIFGFLILDFAAILFFVRQFGRYKRKILSPWPIAVFLFLIFSGSLVFYGSFIEPKKIVVTQFEINLTSGIQKKPEVSESLDIALISDTHLGPYKGKQFIRTLARKLNAIPHHLVLLAGDYVYGNDALSSLNLKPLKEVDAGFGKFAILGNHDYNKWGARGIINENRVKKIEYALKTAGFEALKNQSVKITKNGRSFILGGVDELWMGKTDISKTFAGLSREDQKLPKVLLAHTPDVSFLAKEFGIKALLSGHTHGGQIRLPLIGPVPNLPTKLGRKYDQGLFDFNGMKLLITRGIGEAGTRARLFAPPEIVLLKLKF